MTMPLSEAAALLESPYRGADVVFSGVSTDTRTLEKGNLFVALQGPNFDGHHYIDHAHQRGAAAVAVSEPVSANLPALQVDDTRLALGQLAYHWRRRFQIPVVAVTGSNGKTTVKEMLAAILQQRGPTLATAGNFNNDIGLPHTLFRLDATHRFAVIEMGANQPGEIDYLAGLAAPDVAIVNNAGPAHLEGFGSLQGVASAKGELFARLSGNGVAIINADDVYAGYWRGLVKSADIIDFGLDRAAVTAQWRAELTGSHLEVATPAGDFAATLHLPGQHNVMNALAATAAALALDTPLAQIASGLENLQPVAGRLQLRPGIRGSRLIDDTYNANPESLQAALDVLARQPGQRWLALGDMGELGGDAEVLHHRAAGAAKAAGVSRLFALGELAALTAQEFGAAARAFDSMEAMIALLKQDIQEEVTLLVKGSRSMHMERIVVALDAGENREVRH